MKIGWYSELTSVEKRSWLASLGGYVLDAFDSTIFSLSMPILLSIGFLVKSEAGILSSVSLIGSAIGGWSAGLLADRFGRIKVMKLTVLWLTFFTVMTAFCHDFWAFFALRFLQGLGYGAEMIVSGVLISEVIRSSLRGRVASTIQSGYAVGNALSLAVMPLVLAFIPQESAWRVMFTLGAIPAILVWWIRRKTPESSVFVKGKQERVKTKNSTISIIFGRDYRRITITATILSTGIFGGAYIMITWLPTYLRMSLGLPVTSMSGYLLVNILGSLMGPFICGYISDKLGRWKTIMLFLVLQACVVSVYMFMSVNLGITLVLGYFLGALQGGLASSTMPAFSELYPTSMRGGGAGFCGSFGRGFGSLMPAAVGFLASFLHLGIAMGILAITSYAIAFIASLTLPDMTGADLEHVSQHAQAPTQTQQEHQC